jgi:hypothetical protein
MTYFMRYYFDFYLLLSFRIEDYFSWFNCQLAVAYSWWTELKGSESVRFVWYFPGDFFGISYFNEPKIYEGVELKFSSLWDNMNGNFRFEVVRQNRKIILDPFIIFAIVCYHNFNVQSWGNNAIFAQRYR